MKAFDVGVEPSVVDEVPVRDDVDDLRDVGVAFFGDVGFEVASPAEVELVLDREVFGDAVDMRFAAR